ncbi:GNAT family N-acetyltransferase [Aquicoccus sp. SCR17]|nr:GNAT family N-acetyltransferase [Carideicomes alvinocaridis]
MSVLIRHMRAGEEAALHRIFVEAVRDGAKGHYDSRQRKAWAPDGPPPPSWHERLREQEVWVAVGRGQPVGFLSVTPEGHLDLAFVRPSWMGGRAMPALYDAMLHWAREQGLARLTTDASHLFRAFLRRRGWTGETPEDIDRGGVVLRRWPMTLDLKDEKT